MKAVVCVVNHPGMCSFFYHLSKLYEQQELETEFILIKIDHPYFGNSPYVEFWEKAFKKVLLVENVLYEKNIIKGLNCLDRCNQGIQQAMDWLTQSYSDIVFLMNSSAMYPVNKILKVANQEKKVRKIFRFTVFENTNFTSIDWKRTILSRIYTTVGNAFKVESVRFSGNSGMDFLFSKHVPGEIVQISSNSSEALSTAVRSAPFPAGPRSNQKKDLVIFFGDDTFYDFYSADLDDELTYLAKVKKIVYELEQRYSDCELWYKGHPLDRERVMQGIEKSAFKVLDNAASNAEYLLDQFGDRIKAVYSLHSTSSFSAAMRRVPSYVMFPLLVKDGNLRKLLYQQVSSFESNRLRALATFGDFACIDGVGLETDESRHIIGRWAEII